MRLYKHGKNALLLKYEMTRPCGFSRGVAVTLSLQNQWGIPPKCSNWRIGTYVKIVTPEILAMPQTENSKEVTVQSVCLYFCHDIQNLFHAFFLFV